MAELEELWPGGPLFLQAETQRLSTDSVLLADFVRPGSAVHGVDLGCASGILSLLLLERTRRLHMTGLELDAAAAQIARANLERNGFAGRSRVLTGDLRACRALFEAGSFELAVANPPYFPPGRGAVSPDPVRAGARSEETCTLEDLCRSARWLLRSGGRLCLVHRPERLSELFCTMSANALEPKRLRLVCHQPERAPSLVLVEGRRDGKPGLQILPPLILTRADGSDTAEVRRIYHRP